ncbi:hypothetical protein PYK79_51650 [Streptomyces sp. ID05-04B]|uniref:hypothetical protein n=1 Tax=unclassified Streptomyces TaxID=2593676 RepID=UPI000D199108|nr:MULTISPECIES: hypothetical protein [unclassified Streptomyces]AVV44307.1 hypothetical protein C6376_25565 [Streptomyces sp. P3]MDX5570064.1 hypothetical protein [Streptomyces sp. ID05-04B]
MPDDDQRPDTGQDRPRTALEEVIQEIEEAETRVDDPQGERSRRRAEAADALTADRRAQEESRGD